MQPRSQVLWLQFIVTAKGKDKKNILYCCYQDMVSPMYDQSYYEGLQGIIFDDNCGQGHPVLIYINNKL